ncbi:MAG: hypothetical protein HYX65_01865 [Gemmatimonadetes bacterium]|nr:hypothetical protein [Gemmatimonadota bacterium]
MTRPLIRRTPFVALLCAAVLAFPAPARAQFGSLLKKAQDKVVDKATGAEDEVSPRVQGTELTDEQINKLFKGLAVVAAKMEERDRMAARQQSVSDQVSALREKHQAEIDANDQGRRSWQSCFDVQWEKLQESRNSEMQSRLMKAMSDPRVQQQYAQASLAASQEMQTALAAGDTLAYQRASAKAQSAHQQMLGIDVKKDSATARGPCGAEPRRLAVAVTIDTLTNRSNKLGEEIRALEGTAQAQGSVAAGMNGTDFALAREKVLTFSGTGKGGKLLTAAELERLRARKAEIDKLKRAL